MSADISFGVVTIPPLVMDASAVLVMLLDPAGNGQEIYEAVRDSELLAPTVLPYEVFNVLRRRWSAGMLSEGDAQRALDAFEELEIDLWQWLTLRDRVWGLKGSITTYDAAYIALAQLLDCPLVTADAKLAAMAPPGSKIQLF
jgi:predicted nucleic acid-binding protein